MRHATWDENLAAHAPEVQGAGKRICHVKVRTAAAAGDPRVRSIVRSQVAIDA